MRVIILGGFLGSGKTSILLQLARYLVDKEKDSYTETRVAIIENEVGDVGIDDKVLVSEGFSVKNLFAGCACCSLSGELVYSIRNIRKELNSKWLIIEATGVAHPGMMRETILKGIGSSSYIIAVVDAKRWKRLVRAMESMVTGQIENSSKVLLNKIDLVSVEKVKKSIYVFNKEAEIIPVSAKYELPIELWERLADETEVMYGKD